MAEPHLSNLLQLIQSLPIPGDDKNQIICKHFFSGAAGYIDENIFISLSPAGLALKLPKSECDVLLAEGASPLRYFPKAPIKKGYVVLPLDIAENREKAGKLIAKSLSFVRSSA